MLEKYVIFTGRPNAGKSSVIKEVSGFDAKIGKSPGTTRWMHEYPLSKGLIFVDMPGYGRIMRVKQRLQDKSNRRILYFLESNAPRIALAIHVLDISTFSEVTLRLGTKNFISVDIEMIQLLTKTLGEFPLVAANKIDKTKKEEIDANLKEFMQQISSSDNLPIEKCIFPVSAKTGEGLGYLKNAIHERLVAKGYKTPFKQD
jgi:GTP-binding protein EngB required for normal cell division